MLDVLPPQIGMRASGMRDDCEMMIDCEMVVKW